MILIDTDDPVYFDGPGAALARAADLLDSDVDVVDLAWLRTIAWRERLAGSFSDPARTGQLESLRRIYVRHHDGLDRLGAAADRLAGVAARLGARARSSRRPAAPAGRPRRVRAAGRRSSIEFDPVEQSIRGLAGVTVSGSAGFSLSLRSGPGRTDRARAARRLQAASSGRCSAPPAARAEFSAKACVRR